MKIVAAALLGIAFASSAAAQDTGWNYSLTTYLWATNTGVAAQAPGGQTVEAELSFSDAIKDIEFAFMGAFEARRGNFSLFTDAFYFRLSPTNTTPGPLANEVRMESEMTVISGYAAYRVYEEPTFAVDLAGGFRYAKLDNDVSIVGGFLDGDNFSSSDDWVDPVVGVRLTGQLSDRVSASFFADYGGFSSDSTTWQVVATVGYALNDQWTLRGGYRYMEFDREINGRDFTLDQSGLLLGVTYNF